ncbi:MAG: hypothetical protein SOX65_07415, partial [Porphyromonas sp.]
MSVIKELLYSSDLLCGVVVESDFLLNVLSYQLVGVFYAALFPGAVWVCEVDIYVECFGNLFV